LDTLECRERVPAAVIEECLRDRIARGGSDVCESFDRGGTHAWVLIRESFDERGDSVLRGYGGDCAQCRCSHFRV
jgi:hypothetical protein